MVPRECRVVGLVLTVVGSALLLRQLGASARSLPAGGLLYASGHVFHPAVVTTWLQLSLLAVVTVLVVWGLLLVRYGRWTLEAPPAPR